MDARVELLLRIKQHAWARGNLLGLLHVLIGRRIETAEGTLIANGLTWREAASLLKKVRWDKVTARELPLDSTGLPPRDRERFWYAAIARAQLGSPQASQAGDRFAAILRHNGYRVGAAPGAEDGKVTG